MLCSMGVVLDLALILMLACFMPFHMRMVCLNETTIEGPSPEFHAGRLRNWRQVRAWQPDSAAHSRVARRAQRRGGCR